MRPSPPIVAVHFGAPGPVPDRNRSGPPDSSPASVTLTSPDRHRERFDDRTFLPATAHRT
jgi:hypothetical protein